MDDLDAIRARRAAILAPPWVMQDNPLYRGDYGVISSEGARYTMPGEEWDGEPRLVADCRDALPFGEDTVHLPTAQFITAAPADIDTLLTALDAVTAERDAAREDARHWRDRYHAGYTDVVRAHAAREEALGAWIAQLRGEAAALYDEARYARDVLYSRGFRYAGDITPYPDNPYAPARWPPPGDADLLLQSLAARDQDVVRLEAERDTLRAALEALTASCPTLPRVAPLPLWCAYCSASITAHAPTCPWAGAAALVGRGAGGIE